MAQLEVVSHPPVSFEDPRGIILNILSGEDIRHVAFITSKAGTVRANHWHPHTVVRGAEAMSGAQWIYVLRGGYQSVACQLHVTWGREGDVPAIQYVGQPEIQIVRAGDLVYTPPEVAHAQWFTEDTEFLNIDGVTRETEGYGVRHTFPLAVPLIAFDPHGTEGCSGPAYVERLFPGAVPVGALLGKSIDVRRCLVCAQLVRYVC